MNVSTGAVVAARARTHEYRRDDVLHGLLASINTNVLDAHPQLLDSALRNVLQLLQVWRVVAVGQMKAKAEHAPAEVCACQLCIIAHL